MTPTACRTTTRAGRPPLCGVSTTGTGLPWRIVFYGADGVGKTSLAAHFPAPVFLYPSGDTGLETLLDSGRLPPVAHFGAIQDWQEVLDNLEQLLEASHDYQTVVVDGLGGLERLCHERVCQRDFGGDWGELGFHGYQRGYEVAVAEWRKMLAALELLRIERRMGVVLLSASRVVPFRNPAGADFDRFSPDLHAKSWSVTQRWADVVGFLNFVPSPGAARRSRRVRSVAPWMRVLSLERSLAHDAKNRPALPSEIPLPGDDDASAYLAWQRAVASLAGLRGRLAAKRKTRTKPQSCPIEQKVPA